MRLLAGAQPRSRVFRMVGVRRGLPVAVVLLGLAVMAPAAWASPSRVHRPASIVRLAGEVPPGLHGRGVRRATASAAELRQKITLTVVLKRRRQAAFDRYLKAVYQRSSRQYRHFLTQRQLTEEFGPAIAGYRQVQGWLRSQGFKLVQGSANRLTLTVRGSRAQADRAFDVGIGTFRVGRTTVYANTDDPAVPAALAPSIQAVSGLSDIGKPSGQLAPTCIQSLGGPGLQCTQFVCGLAAAALSPYTGGASLVEALINAFFNVETSLFLKPFLSTVCVGMAAAAGTSYVTCGVMYINNPAMAHANPQCNEFGFVRRRGARAISRATPLANPQKIGLLEFDTFHPSDVANWLALTSGGGDSTASGLSEVPVNGGVPTPGAGESEVLLDIDTAMLFDPLPQTRYVVYEGPPSTSFQTMFNAMINDGDTVISNSWAECEDQVSQADADSIDSVLAQAAASGVSVLNGSGDSGSTCLDGSPNTIGVPADSPSATAVGGSSATAGPGFSYGSETWWNGSTHTPSTGSGGYGVSRYFSRPSYQNGLTTSSMRSVPDVVADADPADGMEICQADAGGCPNGGSWGGTSMSTPEWAGATAFLNDELGTNIGDLDDMLYPLAGTGAFHTAASMGSDFAHVGLGSFDLPRLREALSGQSTGAVSPSASLAAAAGAGTSSSLYDVPADGASTGTVEAVLQDAGDNPVAGKSVSVTASGNAVVSPVTAMTNSDGEVTFAVKDATQEKVTFTVRDTTDGVNVADQPSLTFVPPVATGAEIYGGPSNVDDDGTQAATVTVYLENALGRPAAGKTVTVSQGGGNAVITPAGASSPGDTAVTDAAGNATFSVTDTNQETVDLTAVDTSDGHLPVPGSQLINFSAHDATCNTAAPTADNGFAVSPFASGFPYTTESVVYPGNFTEAACSSHESAPAFDSSGNAYIADSASGTINVLGPSGGTPDAGNQLPDASFPGGSLGQLVFDKSGNLYAGLIQSGGSVSNPEIVQIDPATGATIKVVASSATGLPDCPFVLAVDPLTGDLFTDDECSGYAASNQISRIKDPSGSAPTVSDYLTTAGCNVGMSFAPDGTLYLANCNGEIDAIGGTNTSSPTVTTVATVPGAFAVAVTGTDSAGHATALQAFADAGDVTALNLTAHPVTTTAAATGTSLFFISAIGQTGCGYGSVPGTVVRVCSATPAGPGITLQDSAGSSMPPTGSTVSFTASLDNVTGAAGVPVLFTVSGANPADAVVDADGSGRATMTDSGVFAGVDTVTATAIVNGTTISSAPLQVHWTAGQDTSFLSLNRSQEAGALGQAAMLDANLVDVTQSPVVPIVGATVTLSLGGQSCTATTDGSGNASCPVTPAGGVGLAQVAAGYAGDTSHTAASASDTFELGGVGLGLPPAPTPGPAVAPGGGAVPINAVAPRISGTPEPGHVLSCSSGSWSGSPTSFAYTWRRGGLPIPGATRSTFTVQIADEAQELTCAVTASDASGPGAAAVSAPVLVALPGTTRCVKPSGRLAGGSLGPLKLGMSRTAARKKLKRFGVTHNDFDNFCLFAGWGIRAGYPSSKLLATLSRRLRTHVTGVILLLSANPHYALDKTTPGATLTKQVARRLKLGKLFKIGSNDWYIAAGRSADGVLKVRNGVVQEVGVADKRLLNGRAAQRRFLSSFSNT